MSDTSSKRRLAAVFFADMVNYGELSNRNEPLAIQLVDELGTLVRASGTEHGGKVIKTMGDGFLLTFDSGLEAVRAARSLQNAVAERNNPLPPEKQFQIRIGVHLGDVEQRDGDVLGNGVNVAQRLLNVAGPGEICMTQPVYDQLDPTTKTGVLARGYRTLKSLPKPVAVYAISTQATTPSTKTRGTIFVPATRRAAILLLGLAVLWLGRLVLQPSHRAIRADNILLAVLPLNNVYHDADAGPFIEGLLETLTGELIRASKYQAGLQIIPSTEVLTRKIATPAEAVDFFRVNRVLTGSLQRQGRQVKVVITLEDTRSRKALNSISAVREMNDAFALQEELATKALNLLNLGTSAPLPEPPRTARSDNGRAYLAYLKGLGFLARFDKEADLKSAVQQFEEATGLDPDFALAHAGLAEACLRMLN